MSKELKLKNLWKKIVANGSAWNRALNHSERLEDFNELGSIYFLDICATGTLQASYLKQVQAESYMKSIEFISKYISKYLSNSKIVLCPGGKANSKKIRKALYEKIIKENKDRIYIYGLLPSGTPQHIIGSKGDDLRLINDLPVDEGNCLLIGGKTYSISYQRQNFVSNDSHNLIIRLKPEYKQYATENVYLFLASIFRAYSYYYNWANAVNKNKLKSSTLHLPTTQKGVPDWQYMNQFIDQKKSQVKDKIILKSSILFGKCKSIADVL